MPAEGAKMAANVGPGDYNSAYTFPLFCYNLEKGVSHLAYIAKAELVHVLLGAMLELVDWEVATVFYSVFFLF